MKTEDIIEKLGINRFARCAFAGLLAVLVAILVAPGLKVELQESGDNTAKVKARFKNMGRGTVVAFDLVKDEKGWIIDEMTSDCDSLSAVYRGEEPRC